MDKINSRVLTHLVIIDTLAKISKIKKNLSHCPNIEIISDLLIQVKKECEKIEFELDVDLFDAQFATMILSKNNVEL